MTVTYEAKDYSRGRTTVMGIATAMVVWFHMNINVEQGSMLEFTKYMGDMGVDMFLLASGVGLYFAMEKHASYKSFILRRLRRILPVFLCVSIPWFFYQNIILGGRDIPAFLLNVSALGFWLRNDLSCWYVSAILALYLVTPGYVKLWKHWRWLNAAVIFALYAFIFLMPMDIQRGMLSGRMLLVYRLPVYLMGLALGKAIKEEKVFHVNMLIVIAAVAVSIFGVAAALGKTSFFVHGEYKYTAYTLLVIVLSFQCARIPANPVTDFLGKRSLEVYLLHEKIQALLGNQPWMWRLAEVYPLALPLLALVLTLIGAEVLRLICKLICSIKMGKRALDNPAGAR